MTDDGRTVAVPLTQEAAIQHMLYRAMAAYDKRIGYSRTERMRDALGAVLSASPEALAAALGDDQLFALVKVLHEAGWRFDLAFPKLRAVSRGDR